MSEAHGMPSPWVANYLSGAPPGCTVLDVACGSGRHLRLALERGFAVVGVDKTLSGVADLTGGAGVELITADLEAEATWPLAKRKFGAVIVTNYLWRPIFPDIVGAVASDGLLIYETFARGNERHGRPRNPDYLLEPAELIERTLSALHPVAYQHVTLKGPTRLVQRLVAAGRNHVWLNEPPSSQF